MNVNIATHKIMLSFQSYFLFLKHLNILHFVVMLCKWWNHNGKIIVNWNKVGNDVLFSSLCFTCTPFASIIWSLDSMVMV
jgi:hypothetical protein